MIRNKYIQEVKMVDGGWVQGGEERWRGARILYRRMGVGMFWGDGDGDGEVMQRRRLC